ncbi:MAG: hypothetical protein U0840_07580 [Gemmataceae bacterium]
MSTTLISPRALPDTLTPVPAVAPSSDALWTARLRWVGRLVGLAFFVLHGYANRHLINPDGIAYLEVASQYLRGEWAQALNGYWSPLYSWLLAGTLAVVQPSAYWECATAHALGVVLALGALFSFEWLLREWLILRAAQRERCRERWSDLLPDWLLVGLSYAVFLIVARRLITVSLLTPDLLVAAGMACACALLIRRQRVRETGFSPGIAIALGLVLGLSFLAKAIMLPIGLVILGVAYLPRVRNRWREMLLCLTTWGVVAGPWIVLLSLAAGRPTFGDAGRLNYLWYVEGYPRPEQLAGAPRPAGPHDPTLLSEQPAVTACGHCGSGFYPLWIDPGRFYKQVRPQLSLGRQLAASAHVLAFYSDLFTQRLGVITLLVGLLVGLSLFSRRGTVRAWMGTLASNLRASSLLLIPALAGLGLYLIVGHAEGRLVGPFVLLLAVGLLSAIELPHPRAATLRPVGLASLALVGLTLGTNLGYDAGCALGAAWRGEGPAAHPHWQVAQTLLRQGVQPGEGVASLGFTYNAYWARLGGFHCICEVPQQQLGRFVQASVSQRSQALLACRLAGARAAVAALPPGRLVEFETIPGTGHAYRILREPGLSIADPGLVK